MKSIKYTFWIFALGTSFSTQAQNTEHSKFWVSGGLGKANFLSAMVAGGYEPYNRNSVVIGRYSVSGELIPNVEPGIRVVELGLLYGIKAGNFRFSAGLSNVWGNYRGQYLYTDPDPLMGTGRYYEFVKYNTIGIPAEIRYIAALKHVGIGITAFGNLNEKHSFAGLNVSFYIGRMK
jgi:hypothetical protein